MRPNGRRKEEVTSENAAAGHVLEAAGMLSSLATVGMITVKPLTKYSYIVVELLVVPHQ